MKLHPGVIEASERYYEETGRVNTLLLERPKLRYDLEQIYSAFTFLSRTRRTAIQAERIDTLTALVYNMTILKEKPEVFLYHIERLDDLWFQLKPSS